MASKLQQVEKSGQFVRQGSGEFHPLARCWMVDGEFLGMQEESSERDNRLSDLMVGHRFVSPGIVDVVADDGMVYVSKVHPDLMGPTCLYLDTEKSELFEAFPYAPQG